MNEKEQFMNEFGNDIVIFESSIDEVHRLNLELVRSAGFDQLTVYCTEAQFIMANHGLNVKQRASFAIVLGEAQRRRRELGNANTFN